MRRFFMAPFTDALAGLERVLLNGPPALGMLLCLAALAVTWFIYVPVHELLHVAGCLATGGSVSRLEVAPQYGGALLARVFPFVVSGGEYAGRLSGFDHRGSDWIYLATDFCPFLLTVLIGVTWMKLCRHRRRPLLFGAAIVVGLAPIYNLPGDYYEMGSILITRLAGWAGLISAEQVSALRSDDVARLIGDLFERPLDYGLQQRSDRAAAGVVVAVSMVVAILLALATYAAGEYWSALMRRVFGWPPPAAPANCPGEPAIGKD